MSGSGKASRAAAEKIKAQRAAEQKRKRRRNLLIGSGAVAVAAAVGITVALTTGGTSGATVPSNAVTPNAAAIGSTGPEGVPIPGGGATVLAAPSASTTGQTIDGISCQTSEQTVYHIHAHLTIFVNGQPKQVPAGIGIPGAQTTNTAQGAFVSGGTCLYWLHTHAADGIIHIESPVQHLYTLGNFFDIWGQQLSRSQVGPATGTVTAYVNGHLYTGDLRAIQLSTHAQIQLVVGSPNVAPVSISFPNGL